MGRAGEISAAMGRGGGGGADAAGVLGWLLREQAACDCWVAPWGAGGREMGAHRRVLEVRCPALARLIPTNRSPLPLLWPLPTAPQGAGEGEARGAVLETRGPTLARAGGGVGASNLPQRPASELPRDEDGLSALDWHELLALASKLQLRALEQRCRDALQGTHLPFTRVLAHSRGLLTLHPAETESIRTEKENSGQNRGPAPVPAGRASQPNHGHEGSQPDVAQEVSRPLGGGGG
ncbi:hypothetical protein T484DRAFT_1888660, partial [Baffinella frigidus]